MVHGWMVHGWMHGWMGHGAWVDAGIVNPHLSVRRSYQRTNQAAMQSSPSIHALTLPRPARRPYGPHRRPGTLCRPLARRPGLVAALDCQPVR